MEKKNKKILLITSAILLIGGGVGYWLWKRNKDKKATETPVTEETPPATTPTTPTGGVPSPAVNQPANVNAFQDWMDKNHPNWVNGKNLNKGSGYGNFGKSTQKAWAQWKSDYEKFLKIVPPATKKQVDSLMLQNPSGILGKKVYANNELTPILNLLGDTILSRAKKDEVIGRVDSVERLNSGAYLLKGKTPVGGYFATYDYTTYYL